VAPQARQIHGTAFQISDENKRAMRKGILVSLRKSLWRALLPNQALGDRLLDGTPSRFHQADGFASSRRTVRCDAVYQHIFSAATHRRHFDPYLFVIMK